MKRVKDNNNYNVLPRKILYSFVIVCIYILGRNIPLPWVITADKSVDSMFAYTASIMGTDISRGTIFSLGVSPWITSMIIFQLISSLFRNSGKKLSTAFRRRIILIMTIFMSTIQAITLMGDFTLRENLFPYMWQTKLATVISLIGGEFVIIALSESINQYGIAGNSALILVNILTTFRNNLISFLGEPQWSDITSRGVILYGVVPAVYLTIIIFATVLFEQSEFRIPVYRVMINNDLADDDYIAIKLNPAGTMPIMFAMTFFMIPYFLVGALLQIWHEQPVLLAIKNAFSLTHFLGVTLYLLMAAFLNYSFSFITLSPSELSKQFKETGDCIVGLRPGKETLKYIKKCITLCVIPSCIIQCTLVGLPLFAKVAYQSTSKAFQIPITMIILTSIMLKIFEEIKVLNNFRDYKAFL